MTGWQWEVMKERADRLTAGLQISKRSLGARLYLRVKTLVWSSEDRFPRCCWLKTALSSSSWSPHCLVCTSPAAGGELKQFAGHVPQQSSIVWAPCTLYGITVAHQVHPFMPHLTCVIQHSSSQSVSRNVTVISLVLKSLRRLKSCSTFVKRWSVKLVL